MLAYVYDTKNVIADWVAERIPHCHGRGFGANIGLGIIDDYRVIAGIVYHNWEPEAGIIELSGAALPKVNWYTRETMARVYQYPFMTCHCQMLVQRVPASDERQLRMLAVHGYALTTIPRFFGRDKDGVIATLTYEDWVGNKFNKRLHQHETLLPVAA